MKYNADRGGPVSSIVMHQNQITEVHFDLEKARRGIFVDPRPALSQRAPVILVQRNEFLVGEWEEDCFVHPANQRELASAAEEAVRSAFRFDSFASSTLRIFTCPAEVASGFDWEWSKR